MNARHLIVLTISLVVLLALGACGTLSTTTTPVPGAATTPVVTAVTTPGLTSTSTATEPPLIAHSTQLLINGLQQPISGSTATDYGIFSIDSSGANLKRINPSRNADYAPSWSPDGQQVTFTRMLASVDGPTAPKAVIMVMNTDGTNSRTLTDSSRFSLNSVWSPDGKKIAFEQVVGPSLPEQHWDTEIVVMDADGSNIQVVGDGWHLGAPSWSPDSSHVTFAGPDQAAPGTASQGQLFVYVVDADGGNLHQIYGPHLIIAPLWSPDGSHIAFVELIPGDIQQRNAAAIGVVDSDGSNPKLLTDKQDFIALFPDWSPDGRQIAFVGSQLESLGTSTFTPEQLSVGIYVINADGSNLRQIAAVLTKGRGNVPMAPAWSTDGSGIAYLSMPLPSDTSSTPGASEPLVASAQLHLVSPDGSQEATILTGFYVSPVFDPFDSLWSPAPVWRLIVP